MDYSLAARKLFIADLCRCKPCRGVEGRILFELDGLKLQRVWIQGIVVKTGLRCTEDDSAGRISSQNALGGGRRGDFDRNFIDDGSDSVLILSAKGSNSYNLTAGEPFVAAIVLSQNFTLNQSFSTIVSHFNVLPTGQYVQVVGMLSFQANGNPVIRVRLKFWRLLRRSVDAVPPY